MRTQKRHRKTGFIWTLVALLTTACTSLGTLDDGRRTTMSAANIGMRNALIVSNEPFGGPLLYRPVESCSYLRTTNPPIGSAESENLQISVRPVQDRMLVTAKGDRGDSTALIGIDGELFDFNLFVNRTGSRSTSDTYASDATVALSQIEGKPGAHAVNELQVFVPHYRANSVRYGEVIAEVADESGEVWGRYVYGGVSSFANGKVLLFDLVRTANSGTSYSETVRGFSLVDPETMLPVIATLDSGYSLRMQRIECTR